MLSSGYKSEGYALLWPSFKLFVCSPFFTHHFCFRVSPSLWPKDIFDSVTLPLRMLANNPFSALFPHLPASTEQAKYILTCNFLHHPKQKVHQYVSPCFLFVCNTQGDFFFFMSSQQHLLGQYWGIYSRCYHCQQCLITWLWYFLNFP